MGLTLRYTQHVQSGSFLDQAGQKQLAPGETQHLNTCFWTAGQLSFFSESTYSTTKPFTSTLSDNPVDATVFLY